ncbi:MAG: nitrite reductase small subunit NirD [Cryobacterium sp.]
MTLTIDLTLADMNLTFTPDTSRVTVIGRDTTGRDLVWERVCALGDLEPSWGEAALVRQEQIALFLLSPTEIYAVTHRDPHTAAHVMARGIVGSKGDRPTISSPLHKQVYDLGTGECFSDPALALQTYPTRVVGGFIEVAVTR